MVKDLGKIYEEWVRSPGLFFPEKERPRGLQLLHRGRRWSLPTVMGPKETA